MASAKAKQYGRDLLGFLLGMVLTGWVVPLAAQGVVKIHADALNACAWDQPAADLATAQALQTSLVVDGVGPTVVAHQCTGSGSPFTCQVSLPLANQTVGVHTLVVDGQTVDPVDGSLSAATPLVSIGYEVVPPVAPPPVGSNPRIVKILAIIGTALLVALHYFF